MDFEKRYEGIIKWYNPNKAFGFVYVEDLEGEEKSVFFHKTHLRNSLVTPTEGDRCNFNVREGERGLYCDDISMGEIGDNE